MKIAVVYWSSTGNTETMAQAVQEGTKHAGAEAELFTAAEFDGGKMDEFDAVKGSLSGKDAALFGSYGWGDGEWMRTWEESCREKGANLACDSVICQETPDDEALSACRSLGEALA